MESSSYSDAVADRLLFTKDRIAQGIKADFECLLKKFNERGSLEFPAFASVWKSMKMSMISAGRVVNREARQFTEECMLITVSYFHPQQKFETLIGAFYLLYSLYITQPVKPNSKIRFTLKNWTTINSFIGEAISRQIQDAEFIFHKLCAMKAFLYVAPPNEVTLDADPVDDDDIYLKQLFSQQTLALESIFSNDNVAQISAIHNQYQEMKSSLPGSEGTIPDTSVNMLEVNTATVIADLMQSFRNDPIFPAKKTQTKKKEVNDAPSYEKENPKNPSKSPKNGDELTGTISAKMELSNDEEDNSDADYDVADENDLIISEHEDDVEEEMNDEKLLFNI